MAEPTNEKVLLAFEPRVVMAAMHTTMISASITAYSTAVGPSSFLTNSTISRVSFRIVSLPGSGVRRPRLVGPQVWGENATRRVITVSPGGAGGWGGSRAASTVCI